jgi:hypothetical protein
MRGCGQVRDLFNPKNPGNDRGLRLREHPVTGPYIEGLKSVPVRGFDQFRRIIDEGSSARTGARFCCYIYIYIYIYGRVAPAPGQARACPLSLTGI